MERGSLYILQVEYMTVIGKMMKGRERVKWSGPRAMFTKATFKSKSRAK